MTTNYDQLQTKADELDDKIVELNQAKQALAGAETDIEQAQKFYDDVAADYNQRKAQLTSLDADLAALTTERAALDARRSALQTQKTASIAARTAAWDQIYDPTTGVNKLMNDKQVDIETADGELKLLYTTPLPPAAPTGGLEFLTQELVDLISQKEEKEANLAAAKERLQDLEDIIDGYATEAEAPAAIVAERDTLRDTTIPGLESDINTLTTDISTKKSEITAKKVEIADKKAEIAALMVEVRTYQASRETYRVALDAEISKFWTITNELQRIEGIAPDATVTTPGREYEQDSVVSIGGDPDGLADSQLNIVAEQITALTTSQSTYDTLVNTTLLTAKDNAQTQLSDANAAVLPLRTDVSTKESQADSLRAEVDRLMALQKDLEVDAAIALLRDFLSKRDEVLAQAPYVDPAVDAAVEKTCPSAKVRELINEIRAAYADPDVYNALLARFRADPSGEFLNMTATCFSELPPADAEALRNLVRAAFAEQAAALLAEYFPTATTSSGFSWWVLLLILLVLVIIAVVVIFFLR